METMRYSETRKTSKGPVIAFITFVVLGCAFIVFGMYIEEGNNIFNEKTVDGLVNIYEDEVEIYNNENNANISNVNFEDVKYELKEKVFSDKSNKKIKSNISIPQVFIDGTELTEINSSIIEEYTKRFESFKQTLDNAENTYTYKVTYNAYENIISDKKILSITIWQRTVDDSNGNSVFDKIDTYNIDVVTKELISTENAAKMILGDSYKSKVKDTLKSYVVAKCDVEESKFIYSMSGFEKYYVKNGSFHLIINTGEVVDKEYGVLDVIIK